MSAVLISKISEREREREREREEMFCVLSETQLGPSLAHSSGRIGEE